MQKGKIIVIEGSCDGVGKSTQYQLLYKRLLEEKKKVLSLSFRIFIFFIVIFKKIALQKY